MSYTVNFEDSKQKIYLNDQPLTLEKVVARLNILYDHDRDTLDHLHDNSELVDIATVNPFLKIQTLNLYLADKDIGSERFISVASSEEEVTAWHAYHDEFNVTYLGQVVPGIPEGVLIWTL